jgi:hypothetical protein
VDTPTSSNISNVKTFLKIGQIGAIKSGRFPGNAPRGTFQQKICEKLGIEEENGDDDDD